MKKLYEKSQLTFAIVWIVIYCAAQSLANPLNEIIGPERSATPPYIAKRQPQTYWRLPFCEFTCS